MIDIVIAIDGTLSWEYNRNFVKDFCDQSNVPWGQKIYFEGPNLSGSRCDEIANRAWHWLMGVFRNRQLDIRNKNHMNGVRIFLVGHSRGGHIVIQLASRLKGILKIEFIGLFDAVDRDMKLGGGTGTIRNCKTAYHALRSPIMGSRNLFGNVGLSNEDGHYYEKFFMTSHGALGGNIDAPKSLPIPIVDDPSCSYKPSGSYRLALAAKTKWGKKVLNEVYSNIHNSVEKKQTIIHFGYSTTILQHIIPGLNSWREDVNTLCISQAESAFNWVRNGARVSGLSFD